VIFSKIKNWAPPSKILATPLLDSFIEDIQFANNHQNSKIQDTVDLFINLFVRWSVIWVSSSPYHLSINNLYVDKGQIQDIVENAPEILFWIRTWLKNLLAHKKVEVRTFMILYARIYFLRKLTPLITPFYVTTKILLEHVTIIRN